MKLYYGSRRYSVRESYRITVDGWRTVRFLIRARRSGELSGPFMERLMLAVTQVNGCALCAWGHTKAALESGMSGEEVRALLGGDLERVPPDEMAAVLFAQHYADTRGRPSPHAWQRLLDLYGAPRAAAILGAIRMIMIGNVYGIAGGAFLGRLRGRPDPHSGLVYELAMIAGAVVVLPVAFFHAGLAALAGKPLIAFTPPLPTAEMS